MDRRIVILIGGFILSGLILWHDFPIEFPGIMAKVVMLFVKLSVVFALTLFGYLLAGKKKPS
jgi:hypothetical protein